MAEQQIYLLRIMEGSRVVAEAPLIIHDPENAWQLFLEVFGAVNPNIVGGMFNAMMLACNEEMRAKLGGQPLVALQIVKPSPITLAGQMPNNGRGI
mgnify:CR=1 FL=1